MKNPLTVFTAAALATLAALAGLSMSNWPGGPSDVQKPAEAASQAQDQTVQGEAEKAPDQKPAAVEELNKTPEKPAEMAAIPAPEPPKPAAEVKPELDTVRVESDGQAIVAGRAKPGAEIALKLGGQVIGKGLANSDGSWVVVPDQPLPKGAHEITIEQKAPDSAPVTAEQSIAVAVPEKAGQQAMVALTEPGTATKVLQSGGAQEQASVSETGPAQPAETAQPAQEPAAAAQKPAAAQEPAAQEPAAAAQEPAAAPQEPAAAAPEQNAAAQEPYENPQPAGKSAEPSPETTVAKIEVPDAVAPPTETTQAQTPPPAEQPPVQAGPNIPLGLDAVDYNDRGDIIFSGRAKPGTAVRLYVDNRAVGDAIVDSQGNWAFAGKDIIAPGTHDLRVDQIDKTGKVIARVELPFLRENAEAVAALNASPGPVKGETQPQASQTQPAAEAMVQKTPEPPSAEQPAQASAAKPETSAPEPSTVAEAQSPPASDMDKTEPQVAKPSPDKAVAGKPDEVVTTAAAEQAARAIEPDKPRSGKVVIQPGNNLWKLSRVIYGRGINYTVIYQANKDQIRNPNRIYPGQIFAIPGAMPPESIDPKRKVPLTSAEGGAAQ